MKIVLVSNYYNHHQAPLCREFDKLTDHNFYFIATSEMRSERKALGYGESEIPDYVLNIKESDSARSECEKHIFDADAVIVGSAPEILIKDRIKAGKLVFRYSERPLKNGPEPLKYIPRLIRWHRKNPKNKPIYLLCASAYTASDFARFGLFRNRAYKWGYFPETRAYDVEELMKNKDHSRILWCARFIDWKHPDDAVQVAERLKKNGYSFSLEFIGTGIMEDSLKESVKAKDLEDCVTFAGSMKPSEVRSHMEKAGIYLFTSDRQEGWGAVLNESMNSGCAVIGSHTAGSVPFLIKDGVNGLIYESGNVDMLYEMVKHLLDNKNEQIHLGRAAYATVTEVWNAATAASRFIETVERITAVGENMAELFVDGPCSM